MGVLHPNGKIYIGRDITDTMNYFSSADSALIEKVFTRKEKRDFTIRKQIIWESKNATQQEVNHKENELIRQYRSSDLATRYIKRPKTK